MTFFEFFSSELLIFKISFSLFFDNVVFTELLLLFFLKEKIFLFEFEFFGLLSFLELIFLLINGDIFVKELNFLITFFLHFDLFWR